MVLRYTVHQHQTPRITTQLVICTTASLSPIAPAAESTAAATAAADSTFVEQPKRKTTKQRGEDLKKEEGGGGLLRRLLSRRGDRPRRKGPSPPSRHEGQIDDCSSTAAAVSSPKHHFEEVWPSLLKRGDGFRTDREAQAVMEELSNLNNKVLTGLFGSLAKTHSVTIAQYIDYLVRQGEIDTHKHDERMAIVAQKGFTPEMVRNRARRVWNAEKKRRLEQVAHQHGETLIPLSDANYIRLKRLTCSPNHILEELTIKHMPSQVCCPLDIIVSVNGQVEHIQDLADGYYADYNIEVMRCGAHLLAYQYYAKKLLVLCHLLVKSPLTTQQVKLTANQTVQRLTGHSVLPEQHPVVPVLEFAELRDVVAHWPFAVLQEAEILNNVINRRSSAARSSSAAAIAAAAAKENDQSSSTAVDTSPQCSIVDSTSSDDGTEI